MTHPKYIFLLNPGGNATDQIQIDKDKQLTVSYRISEQGFRDRLFSDKTAHEYRVLLLGDSFTMGHAVEAWQTIPTYLEQRFASSYAEPVSVVNGGVNGAGPLQALGMLRERGLSLKPDAVILQLFLFNDFDDSLMTVGKAQRSFSAEFRRIVTILQQQNYFAYRLERYLRHHSSAYRQLTLKAGYNTTWVANFLASLWVFPKPKRIVHMPLEPGLRPYLDINRVNWYPELYEGLDLLLSFIEQMQALCHERDILFAVYCIPHHDEVSLDRWHHAVENAGDDRAFERYKAIRVVEEALTERGVSVFSVLDALEEYEQEIETLFYLHDGHLTPYGNCVVAKVLFEYLKDNKNTIFSNTILTTVVDDTCRLPQSSEY